MKNLLILAMALAVSGCATSMDPVALIKEKVRGVSFEKPSAEPLPSADQELVSSKGFGQLNALMQLPEFSGQIAQYAAVTKRYDATAAAQGFQVSGSSDLGIRNSEGDEGVATASLTGQRSLNLQSENDLALANIQSERDLLKLEIQSSVDRNLAQILQADVSAVHLEKMRGITKKYRDIYQENKPALDAAISAGIVSSAEAFKFRKTLANFDRRLHEAEAAHAILKINSQKYRDALAPSFVKLTHLTNDELLSRALSAKQLTEVDKLKLQQNILETERALTEAQSKLQGSFVSRITSPPSSEDDWTAFAGVSLTLPVYDGGENDLLRAEKDELLKSIEASIQAVITQNDEARLQLKRAIDDAKISVAMLEEEEALTNEIIDDLKTRLGYGGANISELVSEMMSLADLELQLALKERQVRQQIIDYSTNYGVACALVAACQKISEDLDNIGS